MIITHCHISETPISNYRTLPCIPKQCGLKELLTIFVCTQVFEYNSIDIADNIRDNTELTIEHLETIVVF